jgi:uroporphyrinogen decarboxylase
MLIVVRGGAACAIITIRTESERISIIYDCSLSLLMPPTPDFRSSITPRDLFLRACRCQPVERVPVWIMRQAGRYLPEYQALRQHHSFLELCKTPELAAEVSLQPFRRLGVDAVIVFSDILLVAEAMGLELRVPDNGPVLPDPIRNQGDVDRLREFDPFEATPFVSQAISLLCREAGPGVPILGFAAAPWTLACYMVEGAVRGELKQIKRMLYGAPELLRALLTRVARATAPYLRAQIAAGATAIQIFDTWAGELNREQYDCFALPATQMLVENICTEGTPVILYARSASHLLTSMDRAGADVLSVDWRTDLADARKILGSTASLQGNVDPAALLASPEIAGAAARRAIEQTGGIGHLLNLGHGILPDTPVENAQAFVAAGQSVSLAAPAAAHGGK